MLNTNLHISVITFSRLGHYGRMGNQMFQVAAVYARAKALDVPLVLSRSSLQHGLGWTSVENSIQISVLDDGEYRAVSRDGIIAHWCERAFSFDSSITDIRPGTDVCGYLQSERYFEGCFAEIAGLFEPVPATQSAVFRDWEGQIRTRNRISVSVHVRRGDAVGKEHYHTDLAATNYYWEAFRELHRRLPSGFQLFVFSDDHAFCQKYFSEIPVLTVTGTAPHEDLLLMKLCSHHVIANSTFSWWGAWLAEVAEASGVAGPERGKESPRLILAPQRWFGPRGPKDIQDVLPERWIRIP